MRGSSEKGRRDLPVHKEKKGRLPASLSFMADLGESGVLVSIHAVSRSSRNEIAGLHGGSLKVKIKAPPVDGEANRECRRFLAEVFGVSARDVDLRRGGGGREKVFHIRGISIEVAARRVGRHLAGQVHDAGANEKEEETP